jgi:hypothetical protein
LKTWIKHSSPPPNHSPAGSSSPRSIPARLYLRRASTETTVAKNNWIADLSFELQKICGSPPLTAVTDNSSGNGNNPRCSVGDSSSCSSSGGGGADLGFYGRRSPLTPSSASPGNFSAITTPQTPSVVAAALVPPVFAALSPVYCDCSSQEPRPGHHRHSTPSPPVVGVLPSIPEPSAATSPSASPSLPPNVVGRSRIGEAGVFRRTVSLMGGHHLPRGSPRSSLRTRPIIVRHVETRELLDKQLTDICHSSRSSASSLAASRQEAVTAHAAATAAADSDACEKSSDTDESVPRHHHNHHPGSPSFVTHRFEAIVGGPGSGTRLKVNIAPYQPEDLVVSVGARMGVDGRRTAVDVEAISDGGVDFSARRLHHADLILTPDSTRRLLCLVTSGGWLYIRERPATPPGDGDESDEGQTKGALSVDFGADEQASIPILYCNEDRLEMTLVLHLPDRFRFEDVNVRTVDNQLVITGTGSCGLSPLPLQLPLDGASRFVPPANVSPQPAGGLRVVIPLPEGTDSRSVCASLTSKNQLIIVARLSTSSSRRHTF